MQGSASALRAAYILSRRQDHSHPHHLLLLLLHHYLRLHVLLLRHVGRNTHDAHLRTQRGGLQKA